MVLRGIGRTRPGSRTRQHLPGKGLVDNIVDERLLGAEQVPGSAAHEQEHRQQHSEERASHHGASSDKVGGLSAVPLTSVWMPCRKQGYSRLANHREPMARLRAAGRNRRRAWGGVYRGKVASPENG